MLAFCVKAGGFVFGGLLNILFYFFLFVLFFCVCFVCWLLCGGFHKFFKKPVFIFLKPKACEVPRLCGFFKFFVGVLKICVFGFCWRAPFLSVGCVGVF